MRGGRKDSYMADVGIIRKIDDIPALKKRLIAAFDRKSRSHIAISRYGLLLARHILQLAKVKPSGAIKDCFDITRKWQAGKARFQEARNVAFKLHRLARGEKEPVKVKVLRVMGQVAAIPHVKRHALIASDYAIKLINVMHPGGLKAVSRERKIQIKLMKSAS